MRSEALFLIIDNDQRWLNKVTEIATYAPFTRANTKRLEEIGEADKRDGTSPEDAEMHWKIECYDIVGEAIHDWLMVCASNDTVPDSLSRMILETAIMHTDWREVGRYYYHDARED